MVGAELGIRPALLFRSPQGQRDLKVGQAARRARSLEETVYRRRFATRAETFEYLKVFYNRTRSQCSLGSKSSINFESQLN